MFSTMNQIHKDGNIILYAYQLKLLEKVWTNKTCRMDEIFWVRKSHEINKANGNIQWMIIK